MVSDVEDQEDSSVYCVYDRSKWIPAGDRSRPEHPVVPDCPLGCLITYTNSRQRNFVFTSFPQHTKILGDC